MTIEQLIAQIREGMRSRLAERANHRAVIDQVRAACAADSNRDPNETEAAQVRAAEQAVQRIDDEIAAQRQRITDLEAEQTRDAAADRLSQELNPTGDQRPDQRDQNHRPDGPARVTGEPRTYSRQKDLSGERRYFQDAYLYHQNKGGLEVRDRIERHAREVEVEGEMSARAVSTGSFAGLVPPQYLIDLAAPVLRSGRAVANAVNRHQIPDKGMSLTIPRGTTGASVAAQNGENTQVSNTDEAWANLSVPVCTASGEQDVSRQSIERGENTDEIVFADLCRAHAAVVDNWVINGTGASGQPLGMLNTSGIAAGTAFGAVAGSANFNMKVAGAITAVTQAGAGIFAKALLVNPRRWGWMTGLSDSQGVPIVQVDTQNSIKVLASVNAPGQTSADDDPINGLIVVGIHRPSGLAILSDPNIPAAVGTNSEDLVIAADMQECHLWEDGDGMPKQLNFEQTQGNKLTVTLVAYSYVAFTSGRYPQAVAKLGGADVTAGQGLVAPAF